MPRLVGKEGAGAETLDHATALLINMEKIVTASPDEFLRVLRESDEYIRVIYTQGSCYKLYLMLKELWPSAIPVINETDDHVGALIDGKAYDIDGQIGWSYRVMECKDIERAESWSFHSQNFLQLGECPACDEPLLVY